ncbi:MAG: DoxX family protein [Phormidesmis sp.]
MYLSLAGRICLALIFLNAGINHITGFPGFVETIASQGLPLAGLLAVGTIVFLLVGAVPLLLGYTTTVGAWLLIIFLIPTTLIFHPFTTDFTSFLKNTALVGGLLMTLSHGPGPLSLDGASSKVPS